MSAPPPLAARPSARGAGRRTAAPRPGAGVVALGALLAGLLAGTAHAQTRASFAFDLDAATFTYTAGSTGTPSLDELPRQATGTLQIDTARSGLPLVSQFETFFAQAPVGSDAGTDRLITFGDSTQPSGEGQTRGNRGLLSSATVAGPGSGSFSGAVQGSDFRAFQFNGLGRATITVPYTIEVAGSQPQRYGSVQAAVFGYFSNGWDGLPGYSVRNADAAVLNLTPGDPTARQLSGTLSFEIAFEQANDNDPLFPTRFDTDLVVQGYAMLTAVPEPASAALLAVGLAGVAGWARRRHAGAAG